MMGLLEVNDDFMRHLEQRKLALSDWKAVSAFSKVCLVIRQYRSFLSRATVADLLELST